MPRTGPNLAASIRARLLNLAKERGQTYEPLLVRYGIERLLYRISQSAHAERFALKGATLMTTWFDNPFRPTRDLDLLGFGDNSPEAGKEIFQEICAIEVDDGITFDAAGVAIEKVRDELQYPGLQLRVQGELGGARIVVWIDIGYGDATEPGLEVLDFPVLLDQPARIFALMPARRSSPRSFRRWSRSAAPMGE